MDCDLHYFGLTIYIMYVFLSIPGMVLPPGYSPWLFSYKPFLWCRSDARLRHACCSFIFYKPFMWCRPDARLRHYYFCIFRSRSHSDTRLAPVLLFLHFPLEESFRHSLGTQYFSFELFLPHGCILVFRILRGRCVIFYLTQSMFDILYPCS